MVSRLLLKRLCLLLAVVLAAATAGVSAPIGKSKPVPADEMATPAIDPDKLADSVALHIKDARNRKVSSNNLKQIALALHNYASANGSSLPCDILDKDGKPLLSWRVNLLPYIEETPLWMELKKDEPWDSKHNLALVEKMPKIFASPRVIVKRKGYTVYQVFSGPGALFNAGKTKYNIGNIPDGTSNTLFAVEATQTVPWTKPADIPFDKDKKVTDFGKAYGDKPLAALMDGSVRTLDLKKIKPETLKIAITPDDGLPLGKDWDE